MALVIFRPLLHVTHVPGVDPVRDQCVANLEETAAVCRHEDPERRGIMWNWSTAMRCAASSAVPHKGWHFIVQDDMAAYPDWMRHLDWATRLAPRPVLGLCWIGDRWGAGARAKAPFMTGRYVIRGGAVAYHDSTVGPLADFAEQAARTDYKHDDIAAAVWAHSQGFEPALVSWNIFESVVTKSLVGHGRYPTGTHTIMDPDVNWAARPSSIRVSIDQKRDDEGVLMSKIGAL